MSVLKLVVQEKWSRNLIVQTIEIDKKSIGANEFSAIKGLIIILVNCGAFQLFC
jgi:hypothetical protein